MILFMNVNILSRNGPESVAEVCEAAMFEPHIALGIVKGAFDINQDANELLERLNLASLAVKMRQRWEEMRLPLTVGGFVIMDQLLGGGTSIHIDGPLSVSERTSEPSAYRALTLSARHSGHSNWYAGPPMQTAVEGDLDVELAKFDLRYAKRMNEARRMEADELAGPVLQTAGDIVVVPSMPYATPHMVAGSTGPNTTQTFDLAVY